MSLLGDKIAYSRQKYQFSKKEMAGMIGVSPSTYSKYENGTSIPSAITLYMISLITDIVMEAFVDETLSLEEFKEKTSKTITEMFLELHNRIMNGTYKID